MCHRLLADARLFDLKKRYDEDLAAQTKAARCQECGGRLDVANYQRKPRGGPDGYDLRLSFCCAREGCRTRATPPSLRFLGRKVYFAGMVVLATAMQQGLTPARLSQLRDLLEVMGWKRDRREALFRLLRLRRLTNSGASGTRLSPRPFFQARSFSSLARTRSGSTTSWHAGNMP